jgi:CHASE2 domain-containing sensor protein
MGKENREKTYPKNIIAYLVKGKNLLWKRRKDLIATLGAIPLALLLSTIGLLRQLETPALDVYARLQPLPSDSDVAIVRITTEDYKSIFHGRSPLEPKSLQKIIDAIARGKPKIIGVDIDTSAPEFDTIEPSPEWPTVVWARSAVFSNTQRKYLLFDVLGKHLPPLHSGLIVFKLDPDETIRRYTRLCDTDEGRLHSFPWAVAKELPNYKSAKLKESNEELLIKFRGTSRSNHRWGLSASQILRLSEGQGWQNGSPIKDKVVLLGGEYYAQDEHKTPLGWISGVEVLAQIIETELEGGGSRPPSNLLMIFLTFVDAIVLLVLFRKCRLRSALLFSLVVIPFLAFVSSYVAFRSLGNWAYFVSILVIALIYQLYGRAKEHYRKSQPA